MDGYYTWDAKLSYTWKGLKVLGKLEGFCGGEHITNRKYAQYGVLDFLDNPITILHPSAISTEGSLMLIRFNASAENPYDRFFTLTKFRGII